jgi:aminopeptidase N
LADAIIRLNGNNPQVAARIATGFRSYRVLDAGRKACALIELNRILAESNLSGDVYEIVSRIASA